MRLTLCVVAAASNGKLRNFLDKGLELPSNEEDEMVPDEKLDLSAFGRAPNPLAEEQIPKDWITFDRILDCSYNTSQGEDVPADSMRKLSDDPAESIDKLSWCLVKWQSLSYSACTWEKPPAKDDKSYESFASAYEIWLLQRKVYIPRLKQEQMDFLDKARPASKFEPLATQPDYIAGGKLKLMVRSCLLSQDGSLTHSTGFPNGRCQLVALQALDQEEWRPFR